MTSSTVSVPQSLVSGAVLGPRRGVPWPAVALAAILLLALGLRLYALDRFSTWGDPGWTFTACTADHLDGFCHLQQRLLKNHPPLDRFIRFVAMRAFGETMYVFTFPSVLFSVAGVACTFALARHLLDTPTALLAALLLALHPEDIDYAQEGRNYAILNTTVPLATLLLVIALERDRTGDWVRYGVTLAACFYGHLLTAGIAVAHALAFGVALLYEVGWPRRTREPRSPRRLIVGYVLAGTVALALFMPWLYGYIEARWPPGSQNDPAGDINILHPAVVVWRILALNTPHTSWFTALPALGCAAMLLRRDRRALILPLIIIVMWYLAVEMTKRKFFHYRYVHCLAPLVMIVTAFGIRTIAAGVALLARQALGSHVLARVVLPTVAGLVLTGVVVAFTVPKVRGAYTQGYDWSGDYRAAARYLEQHVQPGDAIIVWYWNICIFSAYTDLPVYGVRGTGGASHIVEPAHVIENRWTGLRWGEIRYNRDKPAYDNRLRDQLYSRGFRRIWLLWNQNDAGQHGAAPPLAALDQIAPRRPVTTFARGLSLGIYEVPDTPPFEPGPFFGWFDSAGLHHLEGPYPHWDLPLVRWGIGPRTALRFRSDGRPHTLRAAARRNDAGNQVLTVYLNGDEVGTYPIGQEYGFTPLAARLGTRPGVNELIIEYASVDTPATPDHRAALFRRLQILPAGD